MQNKNLNIKKRIIALFLLITAFSVLTVLVLNGSITVFESSVYTSISHYINPTLTSVMIAITNVGSWVGVIMITLLFLALPFTRKTFGIPVIINTAVAAGLNNLLKIIIARDRPDTLRLVTETSYGFPSGHAMNNAALYTMVILVVFKLTRDKKIRIPVLICGTAMPLLIGVSRIYLGVHNAGDVLAGWIMGIAVALLVGTVYEAFLKKFLFR